MASADIISRMPTSFVYEDLISQIQTIQNQMTEMETSLDNQWKINKKIQNELKSRSFTFIDPYGNRTVNKYIDHQLIGKIIKNYKKDYEPKYLQQWIQIGTMNENRISPLDECALKSTVSMHANRQQFIAYVEVNVWVGNYDGSWPQGMVERVLLTDNMEKIKMKIKEQRKFIDIEIKSSTVDQGMESNSKNWLQGTALKSDDTVLPCQLYQNNCVIMAKINNQKVKL
jgi:hypothetical protein